MTLAFSYELPPCKVDTIKKIQNQRKIPKNHVQIEERNFSGALGLSLFL
ncbi:27243_t:CDS:2 [Dentiscutata erythropus]|uniref:27243_t:CDS:1 n=1 Tax=Dentiscutata erythropus TaxID=1348616 RepID=A0A9N8WFD1_9GLOM|nr:27243_t:CDS:2 [Dentiscutata erythropus]